MRGAGVYCASTKEPSGGRSVVGNPALNDGARPPKERPPKEAHVMQKRGGGTSRARRNRPDGALASRPMLMSTKSKRTALSGMGLSKYGPIALCALARSSRVHCSHTAFFFGKKTQTNKQKGGMCACATAAWKGPSMSCAAGWQDAAAAAEKRRAEEVERSSAHRAGGEKGSYLLSFFPRVCGAFLFCTGDVCEGRKGTKGTFF